MTVAGLATTLLWVLLLTGLSGSLYFLWTNRPAHPSLVMVVTHGMPVAVALTFTRSLVLLALRGGPSTRGGVDTVTSLLSLALVDAVVLAVVVVWRRFRVDYQATSRRLHEESRPGV